MEKKVNKAIDFTVTSNTKQLDAVNQQCEQNCFYQFFNKFFHHVFSSFLWSLL